MNCCSGASAATSGRALPGGGSKESEGEIDRVKDTEDAIFHSKTSSPSRGVTNENGGHKHLVQVSVAHGILRMHYLLFYSFCFGFFILIIDY